MWVWIGIAAVLVAALGMVTAMQRRTEMSRRLEAARRKQRAIAGVLIQLQRETDFADSYQAGEARELARVASDQSARLSAKFAEATRRLRDYTGWSVFTASMDAYVGLARILEEYEDVEHGIESLRQQIERLDNVVKQAKAASGTLLTDWQSVKERLILATGTELPALWQREFSNIEGELTRLSVETDVVKRAARLETLRLQIQSWERDVPKLAVWGEWKAQVHQRRPLMEASVGRLTQIGATATETCSELKDVLTRLDLLLALTPDQVRLPEHVLLTDQLGPSISSLLNRASVLLSLMGDKAQLQEAASKQYSRLMSLGERFYAPDYKILETSVQQEDSDWYKMNYTHEKERILAQIQSVSPFEPGSVTPVNALLFVDEVMYLAQQTSYIQRELEVHHALMRQRDATYEARLSALANKLSEGLAKLAGANLMASDEYKKLTLWQEEVYKLQDQETPDSTDIERFEQRIKDEWKVIEAAVASRTSIDATLQEHLDHLVGHRRGDHSTASNGTLRRPAFEGVGTFNTEGMAWTSLILAEEALAAGTWSNWDEWS